LLWKIIDRETVRHAAAPGVSSGWKNFDETPPGPDRQKNPAAGELGV